MVETSNYFDWVKFLIFLADEITHWYINCNPDNPFYGRVLRAHVNSELLIGDDIVEFEREFFSFCGGGA